MTTIRVERRWRYTTVDREPVNDERLSFRARGVLVWLLDKPDDWTVDAAAISRAGTEGRDAIRAVLRELEAAGYLERRKVQGPNGRWRTESVIRERPSPAPEIPASVVGTGAWKPGVGKPAVGSPGVGGPGAIPTLPLIPNTEISAGAPAAPRPAGKRAAFGDVARALAAGEWERRDAKPVCGFVALATRCQEALDAGHAPDAIAAAMTTMDVFSRNGFDLALGQRRRRSPGRPVDTDRSAAAGRIAADQL